ncbi:MAG TPA: DUF5053 domain-containing protein [Bacteroidales bacterium]|nr:DUF5053 domain-containing protein [Bacteroidales bacterium]
MITQEKFEQLKKREMNVSTESEYQAIQSEMEKLADSDPEGFEQAILASMRRTRQKAQNGRIKAQMEAMSEIISMSYIAKTYFNKTKSWLSQRINGLNVNGKPASFTDEELETLNFAFKDISKK